MTTLPATPLRIGLVGTGPWARNTQAPALAAHPGVALSGVWGRSPEAANALAAAHGTTAYTGDTGLDELFAASDAIAFALPPDVQAPLAARAAATGRHLLMDKPVATTVAAAREVARAVEQSAVASVVFCTLRSRPRPPPGSPNRPPWTAGSPPAPSGSERCSPGRDQRVRRLSLASREGRPVGRRPARPVGPDPGAG